MLLQLTKGYPTIFDAFGHMTDMPGPTAECAKGAVTPVWDLSKI